MKRTLPGLALTLAIAVASPALARDFNGVDIPETVSIGGKRLKLNGVGLRKKFVFDVYVAALYLEKGSKVAKEVISSDQAKQVVMIMLRNLDKKSIVDSVREGFEKNTPEKELPGLKDRFAAFAGAIPDVKKGDSITITYEPGAGTTLVSKKSGKEVKVAGKDFSDALFSVWLGEHALQESMKRGMLGAE